MLVNSQPVRFTSLQWGLEDTCPIPMQLPLNPLIRTKLYVTKKGTKIIHIAFHILISASRYAIFEGRFSFRLVRLSLFSFKRLTVYIPSNMTDERDECPLKESSCSSADMCA